MSYLWLSIASDIWQSRKLKVRHKYKLAPLPWLREQLVDLGGPGYDANVLSALGGSFRGPGEDNIVALVHVCNRDSVCAGDSYAPWGREATLQQLFYGRPLDCYTLKLLQVWECTQPVEVLSKRSRRMGASGYAQILWSRFFNAWWGTDEHFASRIALKAIKNSSADGAPRAVSAANVLVSGCSNLSADAVPVLKLPWPIIALILNGTWSTILFCASWHGDLIGQGKRRAYGVIPAWPPEDSVIWQKLGLNENSPGVDQLVLPSNTSEDISPEGIEMLSQYVTELVQQASPTRAPGISVFRTWEPTPDFVQR